MAAGNFKNDAEDALIGPFFGKIDDLEIYPPSQSHFPPKRNADVVCKICKLYAGSPTAIRAHEKEHAEKKGVITEEIQYKEIYEKMKERLQAQQEVKLQTCRNVKERRDSEWKAFFLSGKPCIPEDLAANLQISVNLNGKPLDIRDFKSILEKRAPEAIRESSFLTSVQLPSESTVTSTTPESGAVCSNRAEVRLFYDVPFKHFCQVCNKSFLTAKGFQRHQNNDIHNRSVPNS